MNGGVSMLASPEVVGVCVGGGGVVIVSVKDGGVVIVSVKDGGVVIVCVGGGVGVTSTELQIFAYEI
jgi:hypothetical protein